MGLYLMHFTLPGYQGLHFQGVGQNAKTKEFGFKTQKYNAKMIIIAPQLNDWGETSANQTIELVEYFLNHYNIDKNKVYGEGYFSGGETMSLVMSKRANLFTVYLHASTSWNDDYQSVVQNRVPFYLVVGINNEYYGSDSARKTYKKIDSIL